MTPKWLGVSDSKVNKLGVSGNEKIARKLGKLSKFRKLAKSGKKLTKSVNSLNFGATEAKSKILTPDAKTTFNHL